MAFEYIILAALVDGIIACIIAHRANTRRAIARRARPNRPVRLFKL